MRRCAVEDTDWDVVARGLRVHTSIGVGATEGATRVTALLAADQLMYADKRRGAPDRRGDRQL
jgi:hypothetical protein